MHWDLEQKKVKWPYKKDDAIPDEFWDGDARAYLIPAAWLKAQLEKPPSERYKPFVIHVLGASGTGGEVPCLQKYRYVADGTQAWRLAYCHCQNDLREAWRNRNPDTNRICRHFNCSAEERCNYLLCDGFEDGPNGAKICWSATRQNAVSTVYY